MYMQITSSEKIHKLTPLKFEVLDMAIQNNKYHPIPIFTKCQRILLFVYVYTSIHLDFLRLYFSECRWRVCLRRCVRSYVLLIGGSIPQWPEFFSLRFFLRLSLYNTFWLDQGQSSGQVYFLSVEFDQTTQFNKCGSTRKHRGVATV